MWAGSDQFFACRVGQPRGQVQFFGAASIAKIVNGTQARMRACAREKRGTGRPKNRLFAGHEGRCMVLTG